MCKEGALGACEPGSGKAVAVTWVSPGACKLECSARQGAAPAGPSPTSEGSGEGEVPGPTLTEGLRRAAPPGGEAGNSTAGTKTRESQSAWLEPMGAGTVPPSLGPRTLPRSWPGAGVHQDRHHVSFIQGSPGPVGVWCHMPPHNAFSQLGPLKASSTQNEWSQTSRRH